MPQGTLKIQFKKLQTTNVTVATCVTNCSIFSWETGLHRRPKERLSQNVRRLCISWSIPFPNQLQSKMSMFLTFCSFLGLSIVSTSSFSPPKYSKCISKDFGHGGTVCVCSEKDCASFSEGSPLSTKEYAVYTSTKAGDRFRLKTARLKSTLNLKSTQTGVQLTVNSSVAFQKILGFGGAFTGTWNSYVNLKVLSCQSWGSTIPSGLVWSVAKNCRISWRKKNRMLFQIVYHHWTVPEKNPYSPREVIGISWGWEVSLTLDSPPF